MRKKNILSLFDGKSSGFTSCELAGIEIDNYYSAEIDKYAIQVSNAIHPNQTRLGSVTEWRDWDIDWSSIDMIFGGFPCQAWSMAGKQLGDKDERGMLFWTMLDIMKHVRLHNPKAAFLIENVKMKREFEEYITYHMANELGMCEYNHEEIGEAEYLTEECEKSPIYKTLINSALVSAQNRNRYYWTSFPVTQPDDKGIVIADVIEEPCNIGSVAIMSVNDNERVNAISENDRGYRPHRNDNAKSGISELGRILKEDAGKTDTLTTSHAPKLAVNHNTIDLKYRKLTPRECFRLQTTPGHYIDKILACGVSNTQLYKIAGNGWTDEVIAHILRCMD